MTGGSCRRPLLPISEADAGELLKVIRDSGLDEYETWRNNR